MRACREFLFFFHCWNLEWQWLSQPSFHRWMHCPSQGLCSTSPDCRGTNHSKNTTSLPISLVFKSNAYSKQAIKRNTTFEVSDYMFNFLFSGQDKCQVRCNELFWCTTIEFLSKDLAINNWILPPLPGTPAWLEPREKMSHGEVTAKVRRVHLFSLERVEGSMESGVVTREAY